MFGLQKTVYSLATLGRMGESYRTETLIEDNTFKEKFNGEEQINNLF